MNISPKDRKLLWAKAAARCSYRFKDEVCGRVLVQSAGGTDVVVGEECHIVGDKPGSARYRVDCPNRNSYENAVLMCPNHHTIIDGNERVFTVPALSTMKREHETHIASGTGDSTERIEINDVEFTTEVSDADRAVGMEVNRPASLTNVRSTLKATNVKEAIGFSTNQGLTGTIGSCAHCGGIVTSAYTGPAPSEGPKCPNCGHDIRRKPR